MGEERYGALGGWHGEDLVHGLYAVDRLGRYGHRPDRLLVAFVADVDDGVALRRTQLHLVVDLGHQRADCVDDGTPVGPGSLDDLGC